MTTDSVVRFALGWVVLVLWSLATFTLLERIHPRHRYHPGVRAVALAASLLALNAALAQILVGLADLQRGRVVTVWLVAELFHYALHRAMHRVPWLWRFHRFHHDPAPLAWTAAWRVHPVDTLLLAATGIAAASLVGGGADAATWFVIARRLWTIALHANIAWPRSRIDAVLATPAFHSRHHREDLEAANFAPTLALLDRLFGTYRAGG
jgi:sterol desaturase/sphingolipid hydroxylase (fatty acid hydroxylase superfamily)